MSAEYEDLQSMVIATTEALQKSITEKLNERMASMQDSLNQPTAAYSGANMPNFSEASQSIALCSELVTIAVSLRYISKLLSEEDKNLTEESELQNDTNIDMGTLNLECACVVQ